MVDSAGKEANTCRSCLWEERHFFMVLTKVEFTALSLDDKCESGEEKAYAMCDINKNKFE